MKTEHDHFSDILCQGGERMNWAMVNVAERGGRTGGERRRNEARRGFLCNRVAVSIISSAMAPAEELRLFEPTVGSIVHGSKLKISYRKEVPLTRRARDSRPGEPWQRLEKDPQAKPWLGHGSAKMQDELDVRQDPWRYDRERARESTAAALLPHRPGPRGRSSWLAKRLATVGSKPPPPFSSTWFPCCRTRHLLSSASYPRYCWSQGVACCILGTTPDH